MTAGVDLATFFDVSLDLLCIRDRAFRFVRVNPAWETALGWRSAELEGRPMLDFVHPDDAEATLQRMQGIISDQPVLGFVNRYRRKDGGYRHLEWRARHVDDLVFGVARDVTDRLAFEAELAEAKAAAEAANRAKSDFLANMSHEIRTPLNGVIGVAGALRRMNLTCEQAELVDLIEKSGTTLERLVSDVLDVSKIEAGRLELELHVFDLAAELEGVVEIFRRRAEQKGLAFQVSAPPAPGWFRGDSVRLKQVLANLLSNAVKFTDRGEVAVHIAVVAAEGPGRPDLLEIVVVDSGVGFDPAFAAELFGRFRQADASITRRFGGSGLGLSICRGLVELMGGEISARSEPGRGARFRVVVPLHREAGPTASPASGEDDIAPLEGLRVLLAEDHPVNRRVVELVLGPLGVALTMVEDGQEAVDAFRASRFDLVLMDMQMPRMDGLAATRAIRAFEAAAPGLPRTPVIMLSANAMAQHQAEALASGADRHLAKPIRADALVAGVLQTLTAAG
jgi:PAS domain S-box-containing protein